MASSWLPEPMTSGAHSGGRRKKSSQQKKTEKVDELVQRYGRIRYPSHVLRDILESQEESDLLLSAVRRQISLVKCRSQDFEDDQVTIYDKALLVLSKEDPASLAVLELYLTEFLGIVPIAQIPQSRDIVASHIELQKALAKAPGEQTQRETHGRSSKEHHGCDANYNSDLKSNRNNPPQLNNRVEKILDVYHRAKEEYYNTKQRDGVANLSAVRFLRDTAENALRYLRTNELFDHNAIPELERVFAIARDKATELSGGRKRHFDDDSDKRGGKRTRRTIDSYRPQI